MKQLVTKLMDNKNNINVGKLLFAILICFMVISTLLLNILVIKLETRFSLVVDLTANSAYKIGSETQAVLKALNKDIKISVLSEESGFTGDSYLIQVNRIINEYPANSSRITLEYVDYVLDPTFVSKYPDLALEKGNILISSGESTEQIKLAEMFNYQRTSDNNIVITSSKAEEMMTSAILNVINEEKISAAILQGNAVAQMPEFTALLEKNGFVTEEVNLSIDALHSGYDMAILLAPQTDLSESSLEKIDEFLYNDGQYGKMLMYTASVTQDELPLMEGYLKEWGVLVGQGAVFETKAERTYQSQPFYPVADFADEVYSDLLIDTSVPMIMPLARPMEILFTERDKQATSVILQFAETAGVRPADAVDFKKDDTEIWGPLPSMVMASRRIHKSDGSGFIQSDILVCASTEMLKDYSINNTSFANSEFFVKLLNESFGKEQSVAVVPKSLSGDILTVNTRQKNIIGLIFSVILPVLILFAGVAVYAVRRYK